MKHIFLNLKRFDITPELGGVNRLAEPSAWGEAVTSSIKEVAERYADVAEFAAFLPEAHLLGAVKNIINLLRQNLFFLAVSYLRNVCPAPADSISIALMH